MNIKDSIQDIVKHYQTKGWVVVDGVFEKSKVDQVVQVTNDIIGNGASNIRTGLNTEDNTTGTGCRHVIYFVFMYRVVSLGAYSYATGIFRATCCGGTERI